jgi:hypothetical protein
MMDGSKISPRKKVRTVCSVDYCMIFLHTIDIVPVSLERWTFRNYQNTYLLGANDIVRDSSGDPGIPVVYPKHLTNQVYNLRARGQRLNNS